MKGMTTAVALLAAGISSGCFREIYQSRVGPLVADVSANDRGLTVTRCSVSYTEVYTELFDRSYLDTSVEADACSERAIALTGERPCAPYALALRRADPYDVEQLLAEAPARCRAMLELAVRSTELRPKPAPHVQSEPVRRPRRHYTREQRALCAQPISSWRRAAAGEEAEARLREMPPLCREMIDQSEARQ